MTMTTTPFAEPAADAGAGGRRSSKLDSLPSWARSGGDPMLEKPEPPAQPYWAKDRDRSSSIAGPRKSPTSLTTTRSTMVPSTSRSALDTANPNNRASISNPSSGATARGGSPDPENHAGTGTKRSFTISRNEFGDMVASRRPLAAPTGVPPSGSCDDYYSHSRTRRESSTKTKTNNNNNKDLDQSRYRSRSSHQPKQPTAAGEAASPSPSRAQVNDDPRAARQRSRPARPKPVQAMPSWARLSVTSQRKGGDFFDDDIEDIYNPNSSPTYDYGNLGFALVGIDKEHVGDCPKTTSPDEAFAAVGGGSGARGSGSGKGSGSGQLRRASKSDSKLGAHYDWCCDALPHSWDAKQQDWDYSMLDGGLSDRYHNRRPSDLQHPYAVEAQATPMRAAFTDRSLRLREGRSANKALLSVEVPGTEWATKEPCDCNVCVPEQMKPAGVTSQDSLCNKLFRCARDWPPKQMPWEAGTAGNLDSSQVSPTLTHRFEEKIIPDEEEDIFTRTLGRRIKPPEAGIKSPKSHRFMPHRSMSADNILAAGQFNDTWRPDIHMHSHRGRHACQGSPEWRTRSNLDLIFTPREGDPPISPKINFCQKGGVGYEPVFSEVAIRHILNRNEEVFRFADPNRVRGLTSSPPETPKWSSRGIEGSAGMASARLAEKTLKGSLGSPLPSGARSPIGQTHSAGMQMAFLLDHEAADRYHQAESSHRWHKEKNFVDLCNHAKRSAEYTKRFLNEVKGGRTESSKVANSLIWQD